ncbi:MAG: hypothetical protein Q8O86_07590 [Dehalococcoidia bacterium]|nr:hypothetical protein [Dehalococcoidia bacterium]
MIDREIGSWDTVLAIREAEAIIRLKAARTSWGAVEAKRVKQPLLNGLLAAGFLLLCFLPLITVLSIVALAVYLGR